MNFLLDTKAMSLVLKCGVPPELAGCTYLSEAVELRAFRNASAMDIYRTIAVRHSIKPKSVIRDISYALSKSKYLPSALSELLNFHVGSHLPNNLVIAYLALKLDSDIYNDNIIDKVSS